MSNTVRALYLRQPVLTAYAGLLLLGFAVTLLLQTIDARQLDGVGVWAKPAKFFLSTCVFSLTAAWFFGYVREERRTAAAMRFVVWATVLLFTFELAWISWQAAHAERSHFNSSTPFTTLMYSLMGLAILVVLSTNLVLAWEIWRRPADGLRPDYRAAVIAGLVLTLLLGGGLGGYMAAQTGHAVGPEGGHLPVFGWNRSGGDLRVAHFFGIHIEQALPLLMALVASLAPPLRWSVLAAAIIASISLPLYAFVQALHGQSFLPGL